MRRRLTPSLYGNSDGSCSGCSDGGRDGRGSGGGSGGSVRESLQPPKQLRSLLHVHTVAMSSNPWQSMAIGGNRWQSVAISGNQWRAVAINGNRWKLTCTVKGAITSRRAAAAASIRVASSGRAFSATCIFLMYLAIGRFSMCGP